MPDLQIVLWTACVAANGGATEGHKYLQRETVSLPSDQTHRPAQRAAACARWPRSCVPTLFRTSLQGNLKAFTGASHCPVLIDELALAICEHHTALEHLCLQQQFNAWSVITSALLQQPHAQSLRAFPVSSAAATPAGPDGCVRTAFSTQQCYRCSVAKQHTVKSGCSLPHPP